MKRPSKNRRDLSAAAQVISDLIESLADGNQRKFAGLVNCAQPVLSRIVNGQQQPGRDLMGRIAELEGVDKELLFASLETRTDDSDRCSIPIAQCLLESFPGQEEDLMTAYTLSVPLKVFRQTLYGVPARICEPAFSDLSERLRADDLIVIDAAVTRMRTNLAMLEGKLCVVQIQNKSGNSLTLRRVWVRFDQRSQDRRILTCADANVEQYQVLKHEGKMLRSIQLDPPEELPRSHEAAKLIDQTIELSAIKGIAIQVIRNL